MKQFLHSTIVKALLLAAFAFLAGGATASAAQSTMPAELTGVNWTLIVLGPQGPISGDSGITLSFDANGDFHGDSTCNSYGGSASASNVSGTTAGSISLGPVISTKRACVDQNLMQRENFYLSTLDSVSAYKVSNGGNALELAYNNSRAELVFIRPGSTGIDGGPSVPNMPVTGGGSLPILPLTLGLLVVLGGVLLRVRSLRLAR